MTLASLDNIGGWPGPLPIPCKGGTKCKSKPFDTNEIHCGANRSLTEKGLEYRIRQFGISFTCRHTCKLQYLTTRGYCSFLSRVHVLVPPIMDNVIDHRAGTTTERARIHEFSEFLTPCCFYQPKLLSILL